jgi:hypothetical protein
MEIPEKYKVVTPLSKNIALALVILLPFLGFIFGMRYQKAITVPEYVEIDRCPESKEVEIPVVPYDAGKILRGEVVDCVLYAELLSGEKVRVAEMNGLGLDAPGCLESPRVKVSNFGDYFAFEDVSGGIDSMIRIYSSDLDKTTTLYVYGTSTIMDLVFLEGDVLAVLSGYPGTYDEQWLSVYDIAGLHANYEKTVNPEFDYFTEIEGYKKRLPLNNFGEDYTHLRISTEAVIAHTADPDSFVVFGPEEYNF